MGVFTVFFSISLETDVELGSADPSQRKAIWVWCTPHPLKENTCLMLLDIEGLGEAETKKVLYPKLYGGEKNAKYIFLFRAFPATFNSWHFMRNGVRVAGVTTFYRHHCAYLPLSLWCQLLA